MNRIILLAVSALVVSLSGCQHTQLQWHLPQFEIDTHGVGIYVPFPTAKQDDEGIAYEKIEIQSGGEPETIRWTEPIQRIEPVWIGTKGIESTVVMEEQSYPMVRD